MSLWYGSIHGKRSIGSQLTRFNEICRSIVSRLSCQYLRKKISFRTYRSKILVICTGRNARKQCSSAAFIICVMGNCVGGGELPQGVNTEPATTSNKPHQHVQPAPSVKKPNSLTANVLGRSTEDLKALYTLGRELGRGQFGITYLCTDKASEEKLACKSIAKRKLITKEDVEDVRREVAIMHHLAGHENIVTLRGAYEDKHNVHIVMELCAGGELFDRIISRGHYSEKGAATLIRTIVKVVEHCHSLGVMHRDLKPENFLLANKSEDSPLKATDFGLSVFFKPGRVSL